MYTGFCLKIRNGDQEWTREVTGFGSFDAVCLYKCTGMHNWISVSPAQTDHWYDSFRYSVEMAGGLAFVPFKLSLLHLHKMSSLQQKKGMWASLFKHNKQKFTEEKKCNKF